MNLYEQPSLNRKQGKSRHDLSYSKLLACDMGQLIPVMCDEVVPGDVIRLGNESVVRFQPLVAPVMANINQFVHYFFVPYRLLDEKFEDFITGGIENEYDEELDRWVPSNTSKGSLWDFLGFPVGRNEVTPLNFPRKAYNLIYNEYYRDENLMDEVDLDQETILNRLWRKDYFTSAMPWKQRGTSPSFPITGTTSAVFPSSNFTIENATWDKPISTSFNTSSDVHIASFNASQVVNTRNSFNNNTVDLSSATTFNMNDLRIAVSLQRWLERNARGGVRYTEFLRSHFGVSPTDARLQRPEYVGGTTNPILVSEVLQTSSTDATSAQGNLAGHGIGVSQGMVGTVKVEEYGLIMGLMSIIPDAHYSQGMNKQWLRDTKYDFYFPDFANLSEQAITGAEICVTTVQAENEAVFGYQGRYDEMRTKDNMVCGEMRDTFDYWHLGRQFDIATPPLLNQDFLVCNPSKRIFAVQNEPGLIINFGNRIDALRPIPARPIPEL